MKSPFKFLDSYTREDRAIFFGRDQEITELYRRVFESKILLVYGISGTGKSSLINCGLASRFDDSDWLPVNVRRGNNIIDSLNEAFNKQAISSFKKNMSITERLQSIYLDHFKPVYLIFDQFEELFIFGSAKEKSNFIKLIKEVVDSKTQCHIVFVIREEFLAGITEFENDLPEIFTNRFRVEKMKRINAISAIAGPCKVHNIETDSGFSEELIDKLCQAGNEIELTFLQIYLDRIFRIAVSEKVEADNLTFSKELLTKAGSVSDLLGQFLEEQIGEMEDPNTATSVLKSFVSIQGTKKQMTESDISDSIGAFGKVLNEQELIRYLEKFVDLRILRERDESGHYELRHDALAAKIYEKFTLIEKELLEVRLFVENAYLAFNTRKIFLNRDDLEYLSTYEKRLFLPAELNTFIRYSKDQLQLQQRALRRLTSIVACVFLVIVAAGVQVYLNKKGFAQTKELTTLALLQEKADPLASIKTAFQVREKDSSSTIIDGIILSSFYKLIDQSSAARDTSLPGVLLPVTLQIKGSVLDCRMNKDGSHLFGWTDKREVFIYDVNNSILRSTIVGDEIVMVEMSPDAKYFAVVYKNSMADVFLVSEKKLFSFETTVNHLMNNRLVRFFPSGKYFMAAVKDSGAVIYDTSGSSLFKLKGHTGRVNSLDISPNGRFVATASCDKSVLIWNFNHKNHQFSPYDTLIRYKSKVSSYMQPDSIIGPNDTIWSCEFNRTGKYILTASADSMLNIWNLDGYLMNEAYVFGTNSPEGVQYYWPLFGRISKMNIGLDKSEIKNNILKIFYQKIFDAKFVAGEKAIKASNYSYDDISRENASGIFRIPVFYFDGFTRNTEDEPASVNPFVSIAQHQTEIERSSFVSMIETSPDRKLFAAVTNQRNTILLVAMDGYMLAKIPGSFPLFSSDGKYLYLIKENTIRRVPVNLKIIKNLIKSAMFSGGTEGGEDIWKVL